MFTPTKMKILTLLWLLGGMGISILAQPNWPAIKNSQAPELLLPQEYATPAPLSLSNAGWEDGQYLTRDGLTAYCFYSPMDLLAFAFLAPPTGPDPCRISPYRRGPELGVSLEEVPPMLEGLCTEFINSNLLMSHRSSLDEAFPPWTPTQIAIPAAFEGAPCAVQQESQPGMLDFFVFTHLQPDSTLNPNTTSDIYLLTHTSLDLQGEMKALPPPVNTDSTEEDNPHLERIGPGQLVLMFTSTNRPGGRGAEDIWVSESQDNGLSWSVPRQVNFNTPQFEDMPHLWADSTGNYWLYYMDEARRIVRRPQQAPGDWLNWGAAQPVLGPGSGAAVGEPTLTRWGDILFGFVYDAGTGWGTDSTDRFDDDTWILPRRGSPLLTLRGHAGQPTGLQLFPNPARHQLWVRLPGPGHAPWTLELYNLQGQEVLHVPDIRSREFEVKLRGLPAAMYYLRAVGAAGGRSLAAKLWVE